MPRSNIEDAQMYRPVIQQPKLSVGRLPDAAVTLTFGHPSMLVMVPTATRIVTLPDDDAAEHYGTMFIIRNGAAATHDMTINDEAAATLGTIGPTESALIFLDASGTWRVGVMTTT